uniref:Uncharacterized protein n=1 Tax=Arundo donax TaxID=35708 RepID=A0A0A9ASY6_ARUDO
MRHRSLQRDAAPSVLVGTRQGMALGRLFNCGLAPLLFWVDSC